MKRLTAVALIVVTVGTLVVFAVVVVQSSPGMSPPGVGAELSYRVETPNEKVIKSGRKRIGDEPAPVEEARVEEVASDGPVTKAQRMQWIREWLEIATEPGYAFQDKWKAQRALLEFDAAEVIPLLLEIAGDVQTQKWGWALSILGDFGKRAGPWVPQIVKLLHEREVSRWAVAVVLGRIGKAATPALIEVVKEDDDATRGFAFTALAMHRTFTREQAEVLAKYMDHEQPDVRVAAAGALGNTQSVPGVIVPAMIEALGDEHDDVRVQAAVNLMNYGPKAAAAVPALARVIDDKESGARLIAVMALGAIGDGAVGETDRLVALMEEDPRQYVATVTRTLERFGVSSLIRASRSKAPAVRRAVVAKMGGAKGDDRALAVQALIKTLADPDTEVRRESARVLGMYGGGAKAALPNVLAAAKDESPSVRRAALIAAAQIDGESEEVLAVLLRELAEGPDIARAAAAEALGSVGTGAAAAVDPLSGALSDPVSTVRRAAAGALEQLGPAAITAAADLARSLQDESGRVVVAAAIALMAVDPPGVAARDVVDQLRIHDDVNVRRRLMEGIGRHPDAIWLSAVVNRLEDRDDKVRVAAARALGQFGALAKPHVPVLLERLDADRIGDVRVAIMTALGDLGPVAADAVPTLERYAADKAWTRYAQSALDRIR